MVVQKPGGAMQQFRIGNASSSSGSNGPSSSSGTGAGTGTTGNIQLIKTTDGSFIQINGKLASPSTTGALAQATAAATNPSGSISAGNGVPTQYVIKAGTGHRMLLSNNSTIKLPTAPIKLNPSPSSSNNAVVTNSKNVVPGVSTGTPRTLTVAQAQKMGLLSAEKLKELVTQATAQKQAKAAAAAAALNESTITPSSSNNTPTVRQIPIHLNNTSHGPPVSSSANSTSATVPASNNNNIKPRVMPGHQKILIQTAEGVRKQVVLPPDLYKLAQEGKIRAVSIAGKGIQYVRVNTPNTNKVGVSSSSSTTASTMSTSSTSNTLRMPKSNFVVKMPQRPTVSTTTDGSSSGHGSRTLLPMAGISNQESFTKKVSLNLMYFKYFSKKCAQQYI